MTGSESRPAAVALNALEEEDEDEGACSRCALLLLHHPAQSPRGQPSCRPQKRKALHPASAVHA